MVKNERHSYWCLTFIATLLAFTVVILGAYTRLKEAGLGCPDWPTCYGQLLVPKTAAALARAKLAFPHQVVEPTKAWPEMIHRYFAGSLALLILGLFVWELFKKRSNLKILSMLGALIIFQALLGMWTVTWQLLPIVVMGHLLGGMSIAAILWWLTLKNSHFMPLAKNTSTKLRIFATIGLAIVITQIFLGGWTSANYASIICPTFPFCQGHLFPTFNFHQAFNFLSPIGQNYQGGVLNTTARVTIQMTHRYWAFLTATYLGILAFYLIRNKSYNLHKTGWTLLLVLYTQFSLGILNIQTKLSLPIAVMHNGVALVLLLTLVTLVYQITAKTKPLNEPNYTKTCIGSVI